MEYSNNPNTDFTADRGRTTPDTVWVLTYEVDILKTDEIQTPLAGAGFTLFEGDVPVKLVRDSSDGTIYYTAVQTGTGQQGAAPAETDDPSGADRPEEGETVTEMVTDSTGLIHVRGLDLGNYVLRETTVPPGYTQAEDTEVSITASHAENEDRTTIWLVLDGKNRSSTVINQSGSALPTTGGPGTLLFYLFGIILVMGAGSMLAVSKRQFP